MIEVSHISKSFKRKQREAGFIKTAASLIQPSVEWQPALRDLSFTISKGEIVGYIGPNGAGKSTTIKIMSGILVPDSGQCIIDGFVPWKDRKHYVQRIGAVFGQRSQLWWEVPVMDSFQLLKNIYRVDNQAFQRQINLLTEQLQLSELLRVPVRQLSLGQRMRCEIAAALIHSPSILFLDEPTIGLDAVSKLAVRQFIHRINEEQNTTVILTTHDMQDIEALASRVILIGKGQVLIDGSLGEITKAYRQPNRLKIECQEETLPYHPAIHILKKEQHYWLIEFDPQIASQKELLAFFNAQLTLRSFSSAHLTADEWVVSLYEEYQIG